MNDIDRAKGIFSSHSERYFSGWKEILKFKSISADPVFEADCRSCASWLAAKLKGMGLQSELLETGTKPVVFAQREGEAGLPRLLFYGHYDVQPVDPLDAWLSPPFEPQIRDGKMYARGAEDNKGQVMFFLEALQSAIETGALRCPVSVLIEGEEESGSAGLHACAEKWRDRLKADVILVSDTGTIQRGIPSITMGLRGIVFLEIELGGLKHDLHSGSFGGVVRNPATELARLLATLHNPDGSIAVPGYYDTFTPATDEERELANRSSLSDEEVRAVTGLLPLGGERGSSTAERRGLRPTIEINGIWSGYTGPGLKTIIPSFARAKLSSRLVGTQNPGECGRMISEYLKSKVPEGIDFKVVTQGNEGNPVLVRVDSWVVKRAIPILETLGQGRVDYAWEGGSVPVVGALARVTGAEPLMVGFGLAEDAIHSPNESFRLSQFEQGFLYSYAILAELSRRA